MISINYNDDSLKKYYNRFYFKFSCCHSFSDFLLVNKLWLENRLRHGSFHDFMYSLPMYTIPLEFSRNQLEKEYDASISSLQLCQRWDDIIRDKDIFPFIQISAVMDGYAVDLDHILNRKCFSVDDPVLDKIFPPNSFNDRTIVKRVRQATKPIESNISPKIERAFANNVGKSFTIDKKYFFTIPKTKKNISRVKRYYKKYHNHRFE